MCIRDRFKGIAVVLVFAWVSDILQLNALNWLLQQIISMGLLVLVIMFQPELRRGLEQPVSYTHLLAL